MQACHPQLSIPSGPPTGCALAKALAVRGTARPPYTKGTLFQQAESQSLTTGVMGDPTPALRRQTAARTWAASPDPPRDYREAVRPRLPHVTGLGGVDRVTLRPELRVGQGLRLRRLAGSPTCWRAATGRGSRAPAAMGEWGGRRKEITGFPRPPRGVREWKHEGGSEEAVCPALWLGCSAPTPFRARARCLPSVRPAVPARAIPGGVRSRRGQLYAPCPAARHRAFPGRGRRLAAGKSLFGRGGSAFIWARPGRGGASRRALRAGRGGAGLCLSPGRAALGPLKGPCYRGAWGSRTSGSVECQGLERPGRSGPLPSPPT